MDFENFDYLNESDPANSIHYKAGGLLQMMMGELENQRRATSFPTWTDYGGDRDRQVEQLQRAVYRLACIMIELGGRVAKLEERERL